MAEMQKYVEPTGLSKADQMLWDRTAEFAGKVLQWSTRGGMAEEHGIPAILFCDNCDALSAHFNKRVAQSMHMSCRKCGAKTDHIRIEYRYVPRGDRPA